jgi:hypothetical protein
MQKRCVTGKGHHSICPAIQPKDGGDWVRSERGRAYACVDNRSLFPTQHSKFGDMAKLAPEAFLDPEIGATASAILFKHRLEMYSSPFSASTSYAGCVGFGPKCAIPHLKLLKWWWDTGLSTALAKVKVLTLQDV